MGANDRPRVLVIDDQSVIVAIMKRELESRFDVDATTDGADALELIRRGDYALILCDLVMPRPSGYELIETLARESPQVLQRLVAMTGRPCSAAEAQRFAELGVQILHKPFGSTDLAMLAMGYMRRAPRTGDE